MLSNTFKLFPFLFVSFRLLYYILSTCAIYMHVTAAGLQQLILSFHFCWTFFFVIAPVIELLAIILVMQTI